jgi:hypothetical protein
MKNRRSSREKTNKKNVMMTQMITAKKNTIVNMMKMRTDTSK